MKDFDRARRNCWHMPNWRDVSKLSPPDQIPIYRAHLEREPNDAAIWFDLGLAYKVLREWDACATSNRRALALSAESGDPAWWNLGIAATALHDWATARRAWRGYGLEEIADGDEPIEDDFGVTPVRLPVGEVVWGRRIDPARVKIDNIPYPSSGYRWGDVVLNDGAPNGERSSGGKTYNVFDVLERWGASEIPTLVADVVCASDDDVSTLVALFETHHFAAEDWTTNVRSLCRACSVGNPHAHVQSFSLDDRLRSFGIAAPQGLATTLLERWVATGSTGREFAWVASADAP